MKSNASYLHSGIVTASSAVLITYSSSSSSYDSCKQLFFAFLFLEGSAVSKRRSGLSRTNTFCGFFLSELDTGPRKHALVNSKIIPAGRSVIELPNGRVYDGSCGKKEGAVTESLTGAPTKMYLASLSWHHCCRLYEVE